MTAHAPALHVPGLQEAIDALPTDWRYEERCARFDGERAGKFGLTVAEACPWAKGTRQYRIWMEAYEGAKK